jgi:hypothetical protein
MLEKILKLSENRYLIIISIHILKLEISGCDSPQLLTQNLHPTSSTQQAEQASFTREKVPRRASQFSLKINKRPSS